MGFLCCGNNNAVVENTAKPPSQPEAPAAPTVESELKGSEQPTSQAAEKPQVTETSTSAPPKPEGDSDKAVSTQPPAHAPEPPKAEPVVKAAPPAPAAKPAESSQASPAVKAATEPYLTSLLGSVITKADSHQTVGTEDALRRSALVGIFYGTAMEDVEETKKLEVFCAGYEAKTLDVVYCPITEDDEYISSSSLPKSWYYVPFGTGSVSKTLEQKLSIGDTPTFIVLNPESQKVVSQPSTLDQIAILDPFDMYYDDKTSALFQEWIKDLPMEQDVVGQVELVVE